MLHVVGPDGVGKSTLAAALAGRIESHAEVRHFYWRPALLPMPGRLLGRRIAGPVTAPHGRPVHGTVKSLARLLYFAADFIAGYWFVYRPVLRRGGTVIVERGWQDITIDTRRYLVASAVPAKILSALIPRPDVLVLLSAPVETLLARKQELTADELDRQLKAWREKGVAREFIELDSRRPCDELVSELVTRLELLSSSG